jgi:hypothetical protein
MCLAGESHACVQQCVDRLVNNNKVRERSTLFAVASVCALALLQLLLKCAGGLSVRLAVHKHHGVAFDTAVCMCAVWL